MKLNDIFNIFETTLFLFVIIFVFHLKSSAQPYSRNLQQAYYQLLELKVDSASLIIHQNYSREKDHAFRIYILSLRDFLKLSLVHDESCYQEYTNSEKEYIDELASFKEEDDFISFVKAEVKLHAGIIRFQYDDQFSGAIRLIQSYNITKTISEKVNAPEYSLKTAGVLNILFSVIPDKYNFFLNLIGIHADLTRGIQQLQNISNTPNLFQFEGQMIMALLDAYYLNKPDQSASILKETQERWQHSLLFQFLKGLIAVKIRENDQAIEAFTKSSSFNENIMKIPSVTFFLAESFLKKLEYDPARANYIDYLKTDNQNEFVKATYYRLSLISLFNHDLALSKQYREKVISEGSLVTEMDNYFYSLVKNNHNTYPEIEQARLLFDGGYFQESLNILNKIDKNNLTEEEKLEWEYRVARVYQLQENYIPAMEYYELMFQRSFQDHYLVANAHLAMGHILYQNGDYKRSEIHYKQALEYNGEYYRGSIRNEAKTGLSLLKK